MRWAALWFMGGLVACGPTIPFDGDETGGEDTTGGSTLTGPGSSSSGMPGTSSTPPPTTTATTVPGTSSTGPDDTDSSATDDPLPIPDVPRFDCSDADCPEGQWCGPTHQGCEDIPEVLPCGGAPTHHAVEVSGVVGSPVVTRVADVDGDSDDDIVVLWSDAITVVRQDAGMVPLAPQPLSVASPIDVQVGDLDGDGVRDLGIATATQVYWAPGLGDGTYGELVGQLQVVEAEIGGLGLARATVENTLDDVVVFVPTESILVLGLSSGDGGFDALVDTALEVETMGPFAAIDRGFSEMLVAVGSRDVVYGFDPDPKTFEFVEATSMRITTGGVPIADVDLATKGGGVFTYAFVNLNGWTLGGIATQARGIPTPSHTIVGNGLLGFDYAYLTEDDRVLMIDNGCHDAHDFGAAPVAADAGDFDGDGRGDLAVALDGVSLQLLLSAPG